MPLNTEEKTNLVKEYGKNEKDTGATEVQIALLTQRIRELTGHFQTHAKDHSSRRGLLKLVGQRKRLLTYLKRNNIDKYRELIGKLDIRK